MSIGDSFLVGLEAHVHFPPQYWDPDYCTSVLLCLEDSVVMAPPIPLAPTTIFWPVQLLTQGFCLSLTTCVYLKRVLTRGSVLLPRPSSGVSIAPAKAIPGLSAVASSHQSLYIPPLPISLPIQVSPEKSFLGTTHTWEPTHSLEALSCPGGQKLIPSPGHVSLPSQPFWTWLSSGHS